MRNATILVVRLKGTATEAIKNMVLAGIGKLIIVDNEEVTEEDLGVGFFFRDEDVGKKVRLPHSDFSATTSVQTFIAILRVAYFRDFPLPSRGLKA